MSKTFQEEFEARAFHEAGHIVLAEELSIVVKSVSLVTIEEQPHGTRLAPLPEIAKLSVASSAAKSRMEDYAMVRLAGPISEMNHAALQAARQKHRVKWRHWQKAWKDKLAQDNDADLDVVFAIAIGWSICNDDQRPADVDQLWNHTLSMVRRKQTWQRIERMASCLMEVDVMTGAEAFAFLRKD